MLEGLHDTAIEVIADEPEGDLKLAFPPQPTTINKQTDIPNAMERLRAMFPLNARPHQGIATGYLAANDVNPKSAGSCIVALLELYPAK